MKIKLLKKAGKSPVQRLFTFSATSTRPSKKNEGSDGLARPESLRLFPLLIDSDKQHRFSCPTFEVEDFLLACRYLYYCKHTQLISDQMYDNYEKVFLKLNPESVLQNPGSDISEDYPPHIRALGLYFGFKLTQRVKLPRKKFLIKRR